MSILPAVLSPGAYLSSLASDRGANTPKASASSAPREAMPAYTVDISPAARALSAQSASSEASEAPPPGGQDASADSLHRTTLRLPSMERVEALKRHIDSQFPAFLAAHGIAFAPASIGYDGEGQMTLPADYPYAGQLEEALKSDPDMEEDLRSFNSYLTTLADIARGTSFDTGEPVVLRFSSAGALIRGSDKSAS
ncbi:hypothetical protein [Niveibacterium terrae]|uniref:hypothetical protein n=1 Tax=Niveibacterium terrae TaxID=3373598 RepID=UPI003A8E4240